MSRRLFVAMQRDERPDRCDLLAGNLPTGGSAVLQHLRTVWETPAFAFRSRRSSVIVPLEPHGGEGQEGLSADPQPMTVSQASAVW